MEGGGRLRAATACSRGPNPSAPTTCAQVECSAGEGYGGLLEMRGAGGAVAVVLAGGGRLPAPELTSPRRRRLSVSCSRRELRFKKGEDLLELRKERKKQESLVFKELACTVLYFERLTNLMSNVEGRAN